MAGYAEPNMMNNWSVPKIEIPNAMNNFKFKSSTKPSLLSSNGMSTNIQGDSNFLGKYSDPNYQLGGGTASAVPGATVPDVPKLGGTWLEKGQFGLQAAGVGLGVWNALEQQKMNKFMRGYYGDQMDLQRSDFANNAKSTNAQIEQRERNRLSAAGFAFDSAENKQGTADAMAKWGVKETF